MKGVQTR